MSDQKSSQALELHLAGASYEAIAKTLGYESGTEAFEAVQSLLEVPQVDPGSDEAVRAELARLDALLTGLWGEARRGDVQAVDRVLKIGQRRIQLLLTSGHAPLPEAVRSGRREGLEALRDTLARSILDVEPQSRAPLARQLTVVLEQLDNLPGGKEISPVDELARKRTERRSGAQA